MKIAPFLARPPKSEDNTRVP